MGIVEVEETTRAQINADTVEWRARFDSWSIGTSSRVRAQGRI